MKGGYNSALQAEAGAADHKQTGHQSTALPHSAVPEQGCVQLPNQPGSLQTPALSHSASAQGHAQQPSRLHAPSRSSASQQQRPGCSMQQPQQQGVSPQQPQQQGSVLQQPQQQALFTQPQQKGSLPQQPQGQGSVLPQAAGDQSIGATVLGPPHVQQLLDEDVCCAQPMLTSATQQEPQGGQNIHIGQMQAYTTGSLAQPADRASSSGQTRTKAVDGMNSSIPSKHSLQQQPNAAKLVAKGTTALPQAAGRAAPKIPTEKPTGHDKKNEGTNCLHVVYQL